MSDKHAPIPFHRYEAIHEAAMGTFGGFVEHDGLAFEPIEGTGAIRLHGEIRCVGDITITVEKVLIILEGTDRTALIQTIEYSYNVRLKGVGNIVRYDSPHEDHNADHHVHRFDVLNGDRKGTTKLHGEAGWPTLGEVIAEARAWYWENYEKVSSFVREPDDGWCPGDEV